MSIWQGRFEFLGVVPGSWTHRGGGLSLRVECFICEFDFLWFLGHLVSGGLCGPAWAGSSQVKGGFECEEGFLHFHEFSPDLLDLGVDLLAEVYNCWQEDETRAGEAFAGTLDPLPLLERLRRLVRPIGPEAAFSSLLQQLHNTLQTKEQPGLNCAIRIQAFGAATAGPFGRSDGGI